MNAKGVRERGERGCGEALGHPIRPVEVGGDVNELQGAVAGLLTKVVSAHVEVLRRELVGGVGRDGERGLVASLALPDLQSWFWAKSSKDSILPSSGSKIQLFHLNTQCCLSEMSTFVSMLSSSIVVL